MVGLVDDFDVRPPPSLESRVTRLRPWPMASGEAGGRFTIGSTLTKALLQLANTPEKSPRPLGREGVGGLFPLVTLDVTSCSYVE